MKIFICGQRSFGFEVYKALKKDGHCVAGVSSPKSRADGTLDPLYAATERDNVLWMESGGALDMFIPSDVDLIVAAHSHDFIGKRSRAKSKLGGVGYHPSLLPLHRGRDAVRWAIAMGDKVTGGSVYWLSDNIDGGDIAAQEHVFIKPGENHHELWRRALFPLGVELLRRVCSDIAAGKIIAVKQDNAIATWEPSWERSPVYRPELPAIGKIDGYDVSKNDDEIIKSNLFVIGAAINEARL